MEGGGMSAKAEGFLARLYTSDALRERYLRDPAGTVSAEGFEGEEAARLARIDLTGLRLAAESYSRKRATHAGKTVRRTLTGKLRRLFGL
jgi:hypothetical protein